MPPFSVDKPQLQNPRLVKELELMHTENLNRTPVEDQKGAAMILLGTGKLDRNPNHKQITLFAAAIANQSSMFDHTPNFVTRSMDRDGSGSQVFFMPPILDSFARGEGGRLQGERMEAWVRESANSFSFPVVWSYPELFKEKHEPWINPEDGLNSAFMDHIAETQAMILLNLRCNAKISRAKPIPHTYTCCTDYGGKPFIQQAFMVFGTAYLIACISFEVMDILAERQKPRWQFFNMEVGALNLACLLCVHADQTNLFAKGLRVLTPYKDQAILCIPFLLAAFFTIRKSKRPLKKPQSLNIETNQPFLNRDQTEEWKGWMQWCILIYHWADSKDQFHIEGFAFIRVVVAAYLFLTGYNHTTFFLVKKDFSFRRFVVIILRLNLLGVVLSFFMNIDEWVYYFAPLCTFWFIVVYVTMAIAHKDTNDDAQLVIFKIGLSAVILCIVFFLTPITSLAVRTMQAVFHVFYWGVPMVRYRIRLDIFIVYIGMLTAVINHNMKKPLPTRLRIALASAGLLVMVGYVYATAVAPKSLAQYANWHSFISFVPILSFIAVRNVSSHARNYSSRAMVWLGGCSLEIYILQTHLFLAADYSSVLLIDGLQGGNMLLGRAKSLMVILPVFLWISAQTATSTEKLCGMFVTVPQNPEGIDDFRLLTGRYDEKKKRFEALALTYLHNLRVTLTKMVVYSVPGRFAALLFVVGLLNLMKR